MQAQVAISASTIAAIVITAGIFFLVPIALLIILGIRRRISLLPLILGFLSFFVAQPLTRIPLLSILSLQPAFLEFASAHFVLYSVLIGGLTAGLFEESARLAGAALLGRQRGWKDAVSFGLGHGFCEVFLIAGMAQVNNLIVCALVSSPALFASIGSPQELLTAAQQIAAAAPWTFALSVFERVFAVLYHLFASVLIFWGVRRRRAGMAWGLAVLCHTLFNALASLAAAYWGTLAAELVVAAMGIAVIPAICRLKKGFAQPLPTQQPGGAKAG